VGIFGGAAVLVAFGVMCMTGSADLFLCDDSSSETTGGFLMLGIGAIPLLCLLLLMLFLYRDSHSCGKPKYLSPNGMAQKRIISAPSCSLIPEQHCICQSNSVTLFYEMGTDFPHAFTCRRTKHKALGCSLTLLRSGMRRMMKSMQMEGVEPEGMSAPVGGIEVTSEPNC
jgi:hypothetical protein